MENGHKENMEQVDSKTNAAHNQQETAKEKNIRIFQEKIRLQNQQITTNPKKPKTSKLKAQVVQKIMDPKFRVGKPLPEKKMKKSTNKSKNKENPSNLQN